MEPTKAQLKKAITHDLEKRWIPISEAKSCTEMDIIRSENLCACCRLCSCCSICPARNKTDTGCCLIAYHNFLDAIYEENSRKARYNATLIIKQLRKELAKLKK